MKLVYLSAILSLCCCQSRDESIKPESNSVNPQEQLTNFIEAYGSAAFASRRGSPQGMDSDSNIEFLPGGKVMLTEYGYAPQYYHGNYHINQKDMIELMMPEYKAFWPRMILRLDNQEVLLFPEDGEKHFEMGNRAAATETSEMPSFWPFALIHHPNRMSVGSVSELVAAYIGDGERVLFISSPQQTEKLPHPSSIEFLLENRIIYRGIGPKAHEYSGSYSVNEDGHITVKLLDYPDQIPPLVHYIDKGYFIGTSADLYRKSFSTNASSDLIKAMPYKWNGPERQ